MSTSTVSLQVDPKRFFAWTVAALYAAAVVFVALSPSSLGAGRRANLVPGRSIVELGGDFGDLSTAAVQLGGNVLMFLPLGWLLAALSTWVDRPRRLLIAAGGLAVGLESLQAVFPTSRIFDVDDILLNTIGALIGYGIWRAIQHSIPDLHPRSFSVSGPSVLGGLATAASFTVACAIVLTRPTFGASSPQLAAPDLSSLLSQASPAQAAILRDGEVTWPEYERATESHIACLEDRFDTTVPQPDFDPGSGALIFNYEVPPDVTVSERDAITDECYADTTEQVDRLWFSQPIGMRRP